jgi:hypothetical protein
MNQYIINEEQLQSWRKGCVNLSNPHTDDDICKKCKYRGIGMRENCCDFDDSAMEKIFRSHPYQSERDKVLEALKKDLQTRFISSSNQWSKGRNSGLLECCNIIDELRQAGEP